MWKVDLVWCIIVSVIVSVHFMVQGIYLTGLVYEGEWIWLQGSMDKIVKKYMWKVDLVWCIIYC